MSYHVPELRKLVRQRLLYVALICLSLAAIIALVVTYDVSKEATWPISRPITLAIGWVASLYGLVWIGWWFRWVTLRGGEQQVTLYGVTWSPVAGSFSTGGPFRYVRYPLALGYIELLWGLGFLAQSPTVILAVGPLAALAIIVYLRFIVEPRKMRAYGDAYRRRIGSGKCRPVPAWRPGGGDVFIRLAQKGLQDDV